LYILNSLLSLKSFLPSKAYSDSLQMSLAFIWTFPDDLLYILCSPIVSAHDLFPHRSFCHIHREYCRHNSQSPVEPFLGAVSHKRISQSLSRFESSSHIVSV
jgi:hypothetical protein